MHCVVVWQIIGAPGAAVPVVDADLQSALVGFAFVPCMSGVYVVHGLTPGGYAELVQRLTATASQRPAVVRVLVSPPIHGGVYQGWLSQDRWNMLNGPAGGGG